jgi:hypothetical protein
MAIAAALTVVLVWRLWQSEESFIPHERTVVDLQLDWRCEGGHAFRMPGQLDPLPCPLCGKAAYPFTSFACPQHGEFEVSAKFDPQTGGSRFATQLRIRGGPWVPIEQGVRCPVCGLLMDEVEPDLSTKLSRPRRRGG